MIVFGSVFITCKGTKNSKETIVIRIARWGLLLVTLLSLNSCLLLYFFAPKITKEALPGSSEIQSFKITYARVCGKCHLLIDPEYYRTNATIESLIERYREQKVITTDEGKDVSTYVNVVLAETE